MRDDMPWAAAIAAAAALCVLVAPVAFVCHAMDCYRSKHQGFWR